MFFIHPFFLNPTTLIGFLFICTGAFLLILRQILKSHKRNQDLNKNRERRLISVISHDLRSPVQILQSYLQIFASGSPEQQQSYLRQMDKSMDQLVFQLGQIRALEEVLSDEDLKIQWTSKDLREAVDEAFEDQNLKVSSQVLGPTPILTDPLLLTEKVFPLVAKIQGVAPTEIFIRSENGNWVVEFSFSDHSRKIQGLSLALFDLLLEKLNITKEGLCETHPHSLQLYFKKNDT